MIGEIYDDIAELRRSIGIQSINTGRAWSIMTRAHIFTDDLEGLNAIVDSGGKIRFMAGLEFPSYIYRGQNKEWLPCRASLSRERADHERFLSLCKRFAFESMLSSHPMIRLTEKSVWGGRSIFVDKEGLSQHYGFDTDVLDFTANFDVASFFASCAFNGRKWEPVSRSKRPGVIYRVMPFMPMCSDGDQEAFQCSSVGWQPLTRPKEQRAYVLNLKWKKDIDSVPIVQKFLFNHSKKEAQRIWRSFDKGRALFPKDAAAAMAQKAQCLSKFTPSEIEKAWDVMANWSGSVYSSQEKSEIERAAEVQVVREPSLSWDGLLPERSDSEWFEIITDQLKQVRYRKALTP